MNNVKRKQVPYTNDIADGVTILYKIGMITRISGWIRLMVIVYAVRGKLSKVVGLDQEAFGLK